MDGGVGGAGEEAVGVEKRAQAAECDADHDRRSDAGPARQRRPGSPTAHQGRLSPAGHLPRRGLCSARRAAGTRSSVPFSSPRGEVWANARERDVDARRFVVVLSSGTAGRTEELMRSGGIRCVGPATTQPNSADFGGQLTFVVRTRKRIPLT